MRQATWKVTDYGEVRELAHTIEFRCPHCGHKAMLPVEGRPIAQLHAGLVFDPGYHGVPRSIQCRKCRKSFESEEVKPDVR